MKSGIGLLLAVLALIAGFYLTQFVYSITQFEQAKRVSKTLFGKVLPLSVVADKNKGWFVYNYNNDRSVIMTKNAVKRFEKTIKLNCSDSQFGVGTFEQLYGHTIDNISSSTRNVIADFPSFVSEGKPYIKLQFKKHTIDIESEQSFYLFDYTQSDNYRFNKTQVVQPKDNRKKVFYVFFGTYSAENLNGRQVGFVRTANTREPFDFGDQVYRVSFERQSQDDDKGCLLSVTYFDYIEQVENNLWQIEAFAFMDDKVITERQTLPNKNIEYYPDPYLEDEHLFTQLVDNELVTSEGARQNPLILVSPAEKRLCEQYRQFCSLPLEWQGIMPNEESARLLRSMHYHINGSAVRREIRQYNSRARIIGLYTPHVFEQLRHQATQVSKIEVHLEGCIAEKVCYELPMVESFIPSGLINRETVSSDGQFLRPALEYQHESFSHFNLTIQNHELNEVAIKLFAQQAAIGKRRLKAEEENPYLFQLELNPDSQLLLRLNPVDCDSANGCDLFPYDPHRIITRDNDGRWQWQALEDTTPYLSPQEQPPESQPQLLAQTQEQLASLDDLEIDQTPQAKMPRAPVEILACKDGEYRQLFDGEQVTELAIDNGLLPLIGYDRDSQYHLAGIAERFVQAPVLSLDLKKQAILMAEQKSMVSVLGEIDRRFNQVYRDHKAKLTGIVMDVATGEILAAGSVSNSLEVLEELPKKEQSVMYSKLERTPKSSPLRFFPAFHNGRYDENPGSVFKLINAMALVDRAQSTPKDRAIHDILYKGQSSALNDYGRQQGLFYRTTSDFYPFNKKQEYYKINNWTKQQSGLPKIDLMTALTQSVNTWFAWNMDRITPLSQRKNEHLFKVDSDSPKFRYQLYPAEKIVHLLGFDRPISLIHGQAIAPDTSMPSYNRFQSWQMPNVFFDRYEDRRTLRRMAIGYHTTMSPIHLATMSASIATGHVATPSLLRSVPNCQSNSTKTELNQGKKLNIELDNIRQAMKQVVSNPSGTAYGQVGPYKHRVWAKTGTAYIQKGKQKKGQNVWMTGWFCGLEQSADTTDIKTANSDCNKRYAFACNVSYVDKDAQGKPLGGASVCGLWLRKIIGAGDEQRLW